MKHLIINPSNEKPFARQTPSEGLKIAAALTAYRKALVKVTCDMIRSGEIKIKF